METIKSKNADTSTLFGLGGFALGILFGLIFVVISIALLTPQQQSRLPKYIGDYIASQAFPNGHGAAEYYILRYGNPNHGRAFVRAGDIPNYDALLAANDIPPLAYGRMYDQSPIRIVVVPACIGLFLALILGVLGLRLDRKAKNQDIVSFRGRKLVTREEARKLISKKGGPMGIALILRNPRTPAEKAMGREGWCLRIPKKKERHGILLIGKPGSGKTQALLQLVDQLEERNAPLEARRQMEDDARKRKEERQRKAVTA